MYPFSEFSSRSSPLGLKFLKLLENVLPFLPCSRAWTERDLIQIQRHSHKREQKRPKQVYFRPVLGFISLKLCPVIYNLPG